MFKITIDTPYMLFVKREGHRPSCHRCDFQKVRDSESVCVRYPPQDDHDWPTVTAADYCGEFTPVLCDDARW